MSAERVEIAIEGFSGPLDLLCHLVESRQMQASRIKMTQLVRIYGAYLARTQKASAETLADFFFMVARLLLEKTLSLLPSLDSREGCGEFDELPGDEELEERLLAQLARYRPYRAATAWLEEQKARRERCYRRVLPEGARDESLEPRCEIGDLYFLCRVWWGLLERYQQGRENKNPASGFPFALPEAGEEGENWDGMPEALPEESQIQTRIAELEAKLEIRPELSLRELWMASPSVKILVVTLLAVLEMCRMGKTFIEQETLFSDVTIRIKK